MCIRDRYLSLQVNLENIQKARNLLNNNTVITPEIKSNYLSKLINGNVFLKLENLQHTSSFKARGAFISIDRLEEQNKKKGVIAMSAGNHAQAVAWWAREQGIKATIVMPEQAPFAKVMKTKEYGANVILKGRTLDESQSFVKEKIKEEGLTLIHPYDNHNVILGQGTIGIEFLESIQDLDCLIIPIVGGGGISNGTDFYEKIKSGASLAQLYTALIFHGPKLINDIKKELISCLKTDGFKNIKEAVGKDV